MGDPVLRAFWRVHATFSSERERASALLPQNCMFNYLSPSLFAIITCAFNLMLRRIALAPLSLLAFCINSAYRAWALTYVGAGAGNERRARLSGSSRRAQWTPQPSRFEKYGLNKLAAPRRDRGLLRTHRHVTHNKYRRSTVSVSLLTVNAKRHQQWHFDIRAVGDTQILFAA